MKRMKKLFALLMTLAMVMGLGITGFAAAGNNQISVTGEGIGTGATVKYGQIIEEDRSSTLGWKFVDSEGNDLADTFVSAWDLADNVDDELTEEDVIEALIALGELEDGDSNPENNNAESGTISSSAAFSAALAAVKNYATVDMGISENEATSDSSTILAKGLYVIIAEKTGYSYIPMAAYINAAGDGVDVVAKGAPDQITKAVSDDGQSVAPGDIVNYTINQQYLYYPADATSKTFTITDTVTNGTINTESLKVYYLDATDEEDGKSELAVNKYNLTWAPGSGEKTGFTLDFGGNYYDSTLAGETLQIEYSVTAGNVSTDEDGALENTVTLGNESTGSSACVISKPVSFTVIKQDSENHETKLAGAVFTIYKPVPEGYEGEPVTIKYDEDKNGEAEDIEVIVVDTITTGNGQDGTVLGEGTINNLDAQGTYYVKETIAPEGYSLNDTVYRLSGATLVSGNTTNEKGVQTTTYIYNNFTNQSVDDTTLASLPSTGGMGTTLFTIAGCVIMISAAGLFFATRKKAN